MLPAVKGYNVTKDGLSGHFFVFLILVFLCFVVDTFDLVQDVEAIYHLPQLLTVSGNVF